MIANFQHPKNPRRRDPKSDTVRCLRHRLPLFASLLLALSWLAGEGVEASWNGGPLIVDGRVSDPAGGPLPVRIELLPALEPGALAESQQHDRGAPPLIRQRSHVPGHYRLEVPRAGIYGLRLSAPGHLAVRSELGPLVRDRRLPTAVLPPSRVMGVEIVDEAGEPVLGIEIVARAWSDFWRRSSRQGWWPETRWMVADHQGMAKLACAEGERLTLVAATLDWIVHREVECTPGEVVRLTANGHWLPAVIDRQMLGFEGRLLGFYRWPLLAFGASDDEDVFWLPVSDDAEPMSIWLADSLGSFGQPKVGIDEENPDVLWIELPESAVVGGRIVEAIEGRPLSGAWVWLGQGGHLFTTTDSEGRFRLRLPLDDETPLRFAAAGHVGASGPTARTAATSGPLEIVLEPQATLHGRLFDPEGLPLPGGDVLLQEGKGGTSTTVRTVTDSAGRFELRGLDPEHDYGLLAAARGFRLLEERVRVSDGPLELVLERARSIRGRVLDEADRPLDGATVELLAAMQGARPASRPPGSGIHRSSTALDGFFELFDVPEGLYFLAARATGYPELAVPGVEIPPGEEAVDLGTVVLSPGVAVRGRVVDASGRGVVGARLSARRADGAELVMQRDDSPWFVNRRSRGRGGFVLEPIPTDSRLVLLVSAPGYLPWQDEVEVGADELELEIELEGSVSIRGLVLADDGSPVRARVEAVALIDEWSDERQGRARDLGLERRVVSTEHDGSFEVGPLVAGRYELRARAGNEGSVGQRLDVGREGVEGLVLRLGSLARISGQGFAGRSAGQGEAPLRGARVKIVAEAGSLGVPGIQATDTEGRFDIQGLLPGVYRLSLLHPDYEEGPVEQVSLGGEGVTGVRLLAGESLEPRAEVSGWVVDGEGRGVSGALVHLVASPPAWGTTEEDGRFVIEGRVGAVRLQARHDDHGSVLGDAFELGAAGRSGIRLALAAETAEVRGRVSGLGLDQLARVSLVAQGAFERIYGALDWEGHFRIGGLEPGAWAIEARLGDAGRLLQRWLILEGGEVRGGIELAFAPGHRIRGTALHRGVPLVEGRVLAVCDDGSRARCIVGPGGRFEIPEISEGSCTLRLEADVGYAEQSLDVAGDVETWIEID